MGAYKIGQRWISETEPELGLGVLESVTRHRLELVFPAANAARTYAAANAPIKRVAFRVGDTVQAKEGVAVVVESVTESEDLLTYYAGGQIIPEAELSDSISFSKPEERLMNAQVDASAAFALRLESLERLSAVRQLPVSGMMGGRIELIPHQLYIAKEVANRYAPRVLLADEVGLGKTIEACLILHRLILTGRARRVLILLPESLQHQWLIELLRRFNLWFTLVDTETEVEGDPFSEQQLFICSLPGLVKHRALSAAAVASRWDMLVVDEAHHLSWSPEAASPEYALVEAMAGQAAGLLLLTATPEQLGAAGHFARLRLLDPDRYPDLESFKAEQSDYSAVAAVAEKLESEAVLTDREVDFLRTIFVELEAERLDARRKDPKALLADLVDRHGTGRVIFRNTREALQGFPERQGLPVVVQSQEERLMGELRERLQKEFEWEEFLAGAEVVYDYHKSPQIIWLVDLLARFGEAKVLLICRTREKVLAVQEALLDRVKVKAAVFHEGLSLLQRDRNAAWFADSEGARILLCSEIGSEGRNFQFAHHLVLFDLPLNPELLEQRIGRLDRIGQSETIRVHMPFVEGSCTELLMRWHHEGLGNVERSLRGGNAYLERFGEEVRALCAKSLEGHQSAEKGAQALVDASKAFREGLEQSLAKGQDKLIALNSFDAKEGEELVAGIKAQDRSLELDGFMNRIFDHYGVKVDQLFERTYRLSPGQLFTDSFPGLSDSGTNVTFDRSTALAREDIDFLTWDHPMVRGSVDLILSSELGNSALVSWEDEADAPALMLEAVYVLETVAPLHLHVDRFLPPMPLRVVVDMLYVDRSDDFPLACIQAGTRDEAVFRLQQEPGLLQTLVPQQLKAAKDFARKRRSKILENALRRAHAQLDGEADRLRELRKINPGVRLDEIELAESTVKDVVKAIGGAHLRLDALRLIVNQAG
ncbi:MAG: RNA polymerase-associated protein RapA [Opitutia bacterium UBA7350]|nr:MAG: RNA polymerase-associated protein RapA [Opitutae bacterium UBA7350]